MNLYLIAHKVRGELAFDIATCEEVEGEEMWIIPTSGHRAYPSDSISLGRLFDIDGEQVITAMVRPTADHPDHYRVSAAPRRTADPAAGKALLSALGLLKPVEPIKRRV